MILPGTSQIHSETFAQALGWEVGETPTQGWVFLCGVSPESSEKVKKLREGGAKVAAYWIGSDSWCAKQDPEYRRHITEYDVHICVHERIAEELKSWQVDSHVVYPAARNISEGLPPTNEKLVGVYMPSLGDLYMFRECVQIAEENPQLKFLFYGMTEYPKLPKNVLGGGRLSAEEVGELNKNMSVMLRLCRHDGFPVGGIEFEMRNRHVIENYPYPGFLYAPTMDAVNEYLRSDAVHGGNFSAWPMWYRKYCGKEMFKNRVYACLGLDSGTREYYGYNAETVLRNHPR